MTQFRFGPALLAAGLLFCTLFAPLSVHADSKKDELSAKQNQAQQAYSDAKQQLEDLQTQQEQTQAQVDQLQGRTAEVSAQLDSVYAALQEAQRLLDERTAAAEQARRALADKQTEYDACLAQCKAQMGAMQLLDGRGGISLLLAARDLYEMLTFAETLRELDAYVRAQSSKYTTTDLQLTSLAFRCPLDSYGRITTQFGEADPWGVPHRGTDFAAPAGTPIRAIADGIVSTAAAMYSYGNCVQISHGTAGDGCQYDSLYAHMSSIAVQPGETVTQGQVIGYVGNTGNVYSTGGGGYHLHLELRVNGSRTDPLTYVPR